MTDKTATVVDTSWVQTTDGSNATSKFTRFGGVSNAGKAMLYAEEKTEKNGKPYLPSSQRAFTEDLITKMVRGQVDQTGELGVDYILPKQTGIVLQIHVLANSPHADAYKKALETVQAELDEPNEWIEEQLENLAELAEG